MSTDGSDEMNRLAASLAAAGPRVGIRAGQAMSKALNDIQAGAKNRAPVDTGALKNSITHEYTRNGNTLRGEVGPTVSYGNWVENGTSRMRAQPYLRPASDAVRPGYEASLEQLGAEILRED